MLLTHLRDFLARRLFGWSRRSLNLVVQRSRRAHPTRTARKPLSFERLEDRTLLAPFVVTNNNDSGAGSLRQAILSANALAGADTISFQAGLTGTIFLFAGEMDITGNLTITGNGAANTVIDAQTFSRIFDISNVPTAVTFDGLTLQNGQVTDAIGGAIRSQQDAGTVTIRNSILSGNKALGAVFGHGGAVGGTYASFLIEDSTLSGNVTGGDGGALRTVYGSIVIEDSTLSGNVAGDDGGAVYIYSTGDLTLTRCTLTGNTAGGDGGATRTFGAAAVTTVTDCVFSSNYSGNIGGAISATSNSSVVIANSTLSGNHTINSGGAVYVQGDLHVTSSTLSGNYTRISFSTGGAIASPAAGNVTIVNSTISGNQALDGPSGGVGGMRGGGIFFNAGDSTIVNSTITNNSASNGGGISIYANNNGESLTIHNSIIAGNAAQFGETEFTAPGNPGVNLLVTRSLIGRSDGTTLTPTMGLTPDGAGNFIGGATAGTGLTAAQIGLFPLADNGGPHLTHALLPTSLALNAGLNARATIDGQPGSAVLTSDQRGAPFHRIFGAGSGGGVDMGAFEDQALSITGSAAYIRGTPNRDSIVYRIANKQANVNGVNYVLPANITLVVIEGDDDKDTLNLIGTASAETVTTGSGVLSVEHNAAHTGDDIIGLRLEVIILDGQGGNDAVTFDDTAGDDKFFARPNSGFMIDVGGQFEIDAFGYDMTGVFTSGNDLAKFFDAPGGGNDTLTANPTIATIQGTGFLHTAQNFDVLVASSRNGSDVANIFGTTGNDAFTGRAGVAVLSGTGFNYQLDGYATINADGLGGSDLVKFFGGPGNDSLTANPTSATFVTGGFTLNTASFERLIGTAGSGANDVAILTDSAGNDIFAGTIGTGELAGTGFFERVINFDTVTIRGVNGGTNRRTLNNIAFTLIEQGTWV